MPAHLFSYGTLRRGLAPGRLAALVEGFAWEGEARLPGRLYDLGAYPGALLGDPGGGWIHGELARVGDDPGLWELLDAYEGADAVPPLFRRVEAWVRTADDRRLRAWLYEYARDPGAAPRLGDGRYRGDGARGTLGLRSANRVARRRA